MCTSTKNEIRSLAEGYRYTNINMHQTKHPEFLIQDILSYATVFYVQKNIRIMLLCGLHISGGKNYLP